MSARSRRNARLALTIAALVALELAWRATASPDDPRVVRADFGASAAALLVLSAINFLSRLFKGKVDPNVARSLEGLRSGLVDLGKAILEGLTAVAWRFAQVWDWLRKWFGRIFRELADVIGAVVKRLSRILDRVLGPVIDFLDKVRKHVWAIYNDIVKPILDIIEFIRLPLKILSAFNVEWAKRLDATLANLEDWIVDQFTFVMGKLNQAINVLNGIVDVSGLLKRITLIKSLRRDGNIWLSFAWNKLHRPLEPAKRQDYRRELPTELADRRAGQLDEYVRTGGGELAPLIDEALADALLIAWRMRSGL